MPWNDLAVGAAAGSATTAIVLNMFLQLYFQRELKRPELIHAPEEGRDVSDRHLLQEVKLLLRDYWPHPILEFSGYISTVWSGMWAVLPSRISPGKEELILLKDGGTISLHWSALEKPGKRERIALVIPGLNNDSRTSFVQDTMRHLEQEGFHAVAMNYRGQGRLELTSPRFGCADSWQDLPEAIAHLERTNPGAEIYGIGFSMGAGMLLRHLGEVGVQARLKAAVAIAAPVDFPAVAAALESTLKKRLINFAMVTGVKLFLMKSAFMSEYTASINKGAVLRATTLRQLEDASIAPLHGYEDAWDYYEQNSPRPKLASICIPTLIVNAADDPVVSVTTLPVDDLRANRNIYLAITRRGGHIGWSSGGLGVAAWTDSMAGDFFQACSLRSRL